MKKIILIILTILLFFMTALAIFWEPVMDLLPIDQSGWVIKDEVHYYLDEDGDPITGWQELGGYRYYFRAADGAMVTGWTEIDGSRYCFDEDGHMLRNRWMEGEQGTCYLNADGTVATGWLEKDDIRYYLSAEGAPVTGWQEIEGVPYCFSEEGAMLTGWQDLADGRYYLSAEGGVSIGWQEIDGSRYYLGEDGKMQTGWVDVDGVRYYLNEDGTPASEWLELDGTFYRLNDDGSIYSGWLEQKIGTFYIKEDGTPYLGWLERDGQTYYLNPETGTAAVGKQVIDDKTYFFTSTGASIVLVNPWNYIPEDYEVELVELESGHKVAKECYDALMKMMADCEAAGHKPYLYSSYRTQSHQQTLFNNMVAKQNGDKAKAAQIVAVPGTSEHQLGLAVDITDNAYRKLDYDQEKTKTQQWLMEHCWEYGFILRYPSDKSTITGIIYEPWHYRYVGLELAQELKELDICLEEYLDMLTGDGTTCGGT